MTPHIRTRGTYLLIPCDLCVRVGGAVRSQVIEDVEEHGACSCTGGGAGLAIGVEWGERGWERTQVEGTEGVTWYEVEWC